MKVFFLFFALLLVGCEGFYRQVSNHGARVFGGNWIIVQYRMDGTVTQCWKLEEVSVSNEEQSDGIYWKDSSGHLVHISGWYNRVQVEGLDFDGAAKALGIDYKECK